MTGRFFVVLVLIVFIFSSCVVGIAFATDVERNDSGTTFNPVYNKYLVVDSFPKSVVRVVDDDVKIRYKGGEITLKGIDEESAKKIRMTDRKAIVFGGAFSVDKNGRNVIVSSLSIVNQDGSLNSMISYRMMRSQGTIQKTSENLYEFKSGDMVTKIEGIDNDINEGIIIRCGKEVFIEGFYDEILNKLFVVEIMNDSDDNIEISGMLSKDDEAGYNLEMILDNNKILNIPVEIDPASMQAPVAMEESINMMVVLSGKSIFDNNLKRNIFEVFKVMSAEEVDNPPLEIIEKEEIDESVVSSVYKSNEVEAESVVIATYGEHEDEPELDVIVENQIDDAQNNVEDESNQLVEETEQTNNEGENVEVEESKLPEVSIPEQTE